jgi:pyruvate/2-oxoglutarate dehydrogenase complex dihydrolipoamide acyltransferase (E2) component
MATTVKLPKFGLTMEEATITAWLVGVGESVEEGQALASIDSEKVTIDLPSPVGGVLAEFLVQVDDTVSVGTHIAVVVADRDEFERYTSQEG